MVADREKNRESQIGVTAIWLGGEGTQLLFHGTAAKKNRYVPLGL